LHQLRWSPHFVTFQPHPLIASHQLRPRWREYCTAKERYAPRRGRTIRAIHESGMSSGAGRRGGSVVAAQAPEKEETMYLEKQLGLTELLPQGAAVMMAIAFWTAGLALASASVWNVNRVHRLHEPIAGWSSTALTSTPTYNPPADTPLVMDEQPAIVEMPTDVIVAHTTPASGATDLQKR
jgi:hypothetical protein